MLLNVKGLIQGELKHGLNWLRMLFENLGIPGLQKNHVSTSKIKVF